MRAAQQGSLRLYQCHCVLPINLFNEKICSIWWFYVAALLPITAASLFVWVVRSLAPSVRSRFIRRCCCSTSQVEAEEADEILQRSLGPDGFFLLRLIEINHGSAVLQPIIRQIVHRCCVATRMRATDFSSDLPSTSVSLEMTGSDEPGAAARPAPITSISGSQHPLQQPSSSLRLKYPIGGLLTAHGRPVPFRRMRSRRSLHIHPTGSHPGLLF